MRGEGEREMEKRGYEVREREERKEKQKKKDEKRITVQKGRLGVRRDHDENQHPHKTMESAENS